MGRLVVVVAVLVVCGGGLAAASGGCETSQALLTLPGRAYVAGIFDIHEGENCSVEISSGRQKMAAAAWVVSALNWQLTEPDVQLGLRVYDACSSELSSQMAFMAAAVDADCKETYSLGVVTSSAVWSRLGELRSALPLSLSARPADVEGRALPLLLETAAGLLRAAGSRGAACLLASSRHLLTDFQRRAARQGLCLPAPDSTLLLTDLPTGWSPPTDGTCVVLGPWAQVSAAVSALGNGSAPGWLLVATDGVPEAAAALQAVPEGALLVEPRLSLSLSAPAGNASVSYAAFLDVAAAVASAAARYHAALRDRCGFAPEDYVQCLALLPPTQELEATSGEDGGATLRGLLEAAGAAWLSPAASRVTSDEEAGRRLAPVAAYSSVDGEGDVQLVLTADVSLPPEGNETCYTFDEEAAAPAEPAEAAWPQWEVEFRPEPWAAAVAAVVSLGLAVCVAVGAHLAWRVAAGDVLEGRPALTLLLLLATAGALATAAAFLVRARDPPLQALLCAARASAAALSYALLFSLMLARALMLAACDADGAVASSFLSHVNGYLQSSLCFLMALTPSTLVLQFWLEWPSGAGQREACRGGGVALSLQLGCDALLLLLLVSVSPLAARSRRNYREGACFLAAALLSAAVWAGWLAAFLLAGDAWRDAALASGLAATACCVVVAVFVPRTYLMLSSAVRSHLASALPGSLAASACALNSAAALGGVAGSQQGLYASVNADLAGPGAGAAAGNFYSPDAGLPFGGSPRVHSKLSHF
ncbi:uncharacterized protein LOC126176263 [Schistocerca cancellata]|uniref:uncharacterized protein LOC126176263 n=1 Tax=Schistocerca cancellata TaxID=274614 RepID=UPI0021199161|nr:uncharacterized protein LOC126176263 [Schistocerca cancellata]